MFYFFIGFLIGMVIGILLMCFLQVNRLNDDSN